jgi:MFS family permease
MFVKTAQLTASFPLELTIWCAIAMAIDIGVARLTYGAVLPGIIRDLHLTYTSAGILGASNLAAYLVGNLVAPQLGRRFGMPWLAFFGHAAVALGVAISGVAYEPTLLGVGRILMGGGAGIGIVAMIVLLFEAAPSQRHLTSPGIWAGIGLAAIATGLTLQYTLNGPGHWRYVFLGSAAVAVLLIFRFQPGALRKIERKATAPENARDEALRTTSVLAWMPLFAAYFMFGVAYIAYATFVGARLAAEGAPLSLISANWSVFGITVIIGCMGISFLLSSSALRRSTLTLALVSGAAGCAVSSLPGFTATLVSAGLVGLGLSACPAVVAAYVRERTTAGNYPYFFSLATTVMGAGQLLGPVVAGALADRFGPGSVSVFAAVSYGLGAGLALLDALGRSQLQQPKPHLSSGPTSGSNLTFGT